MRSAVYYAVTVSKFDILVSHYNEVSSISRIAVFSNHLTSLLTHRREPAASCGALCGERGLHAVAVPV